jgi:hypothetical protein
VRKGRLRAIRCNSANISPSFRSNAGVSRGWSAPLAEWIAGTNPTNAASCLRLLAPSATATNGIVLRWPSVAGKTYRLERATNLLVGFNAVVRSNISATPPTNSEPDTAVLPTDARYYRIMVEQ